MKPTPKEFASRLAPSQGNFSVLATTPWISSMCPATLVRLNLVRCPQSLGPTLVALRHTVFGLAGYPVHLANSQSARFSLARECAVRKTCHRRNDGRKNRLEQ